VLTVESGQVVREGTQRLGEIDELTLERARQGDAASFMTILRHYDRMLRVVASRLLSDRQAMDDVMQDVALKAWKGLPQFRHEAPLGAWLCRIATTTCLDRLRRGGREIPTEPSALTLPAEPADDLETTGRRQGLLTALTSLPTEQRVAVLMIDQFGYSFRDAAVVLDVPQGTVASRVASARARLREALAGMREAP
jgi:RNA polymerase sigma-70 factor (ECF subfamily)